MCGVAGFFQPGGLSAPDSGALIRELLAGLAHRGPDDGDEWLDGAAGIALGHRRLAVIDLSSAGRQPMVSASGRYVITFNGEIYNHRQMRQELSRNEPSPSWRGHSDTETLLAAFDHWGVETALERSVGMFALALWDCAERTLTLARDRVGEKPLYFGWQGDCFLFGSELKALRAHPAFRADIDRDALAEYLRFGYIPEPLSIYSGIYKLMPGTFMQLSEKNSPGTLPPTKSYWSLKNIAEHGLANPFAGSEHDAAEELEQLLRQAISLQSIADVPLGAFLSGGIDSSTIVALMQSQSAGRVKTFTIGFEEGGFSEAANAKQVAQHLGTDHTELCVTPREAMDVIPTLPQFYDEPFGDSSAIPTILVSRLAREQVTVSLSGDGGDELFGGYSRYRRSHDFWQWAGWIPFGARHAVSRGLRAISQRSGTTGLGCRANRLCRYLSARNPGDVYNVQISQRLDERNVVLGCSDRSPNSIPTLNCGLFYDSMMYADTMTYLPGDILAKVDRASMSVSLESRVPMLDHRVIEFAWQLPLHMKVHNGKGKQLLRRVLDKYIPDSLVNRPKMGFGVPVGEWIRGPLREWAEGLVSEERLRDEGFLNPQLVRDQWTQHLNGAASSDDSIWQLLMFQEWLAQDHRPSPVATHLAYPANRISTYV